MKLGDLFKITSGGTPDTKNPSYYEGGHIPWIKTGDLKEKYIHESVEHITEDGLNNSSAKIFPVDTVLVAMYGATIGACSILPFEAATNQACAAFTPNDHILPNYLYYFLCSKKEQFIRDAVGGAQPNISAGYLKNVEFYCPPLSEQYHIAAILDKSTDIISLRKQQVTKLNELVKSRFVEMFGDPSNNPFRWRQMTLYDIAKEKLSYGSCASAIKYDGSVRYIRITDINDNGELLDDIKSPDTFDAKYLLNDGDILFARSGATVGKTFQFKKEYGKCIYAGYLIRLVPNVNIVLPEYILQFTKSNYYILFIKSTKRSVAQPNINAKEYGNLVINVPPLDKQREFVSFSRQVEQTKSAIKQSLNQLETLKKSLMQDFFG